MDPKNIQNTQNTQTDKTKQTDKNIDDFNKEIKKQGIEIGNTITQFAQDAIRFSICLLIIICIILYVFISGGIAVYLSKLGASNILPTNNEFFPYTNVKPSIIPSSTNIFTNSKIDFPYDTYNSSNYLLNGTRKYKDKMQSSFYLVYLIMHYFITIYENMVQLNYAAINFGLYLMNKIPSDTIILLFGPTILTILMCIISFINPIYFIFTWFVSLRTFFEFEKNTAQLAATSNIKGNWLVLLSIICALWMACVMFVMFFFSTWLTFLIVSIISFLILLSCYFYAATINGVNVTIISTILGLLKFYKLYLMILISFIIILMSFLNFGIWGIVTCSVILLLIYLEAFAGLGIDMFSQPVKLTGSL